MVGERYGEGRAVSGLAVEGEVGLQAYRWVCETPFRGIRAHFRHSGRT